MRKIYLMGLAAILGGCGSVDYDAAAVGSFSGSLFVMWVDEGGSFGDGTFVYIPNPDDPLTFTRGGTEEYKVIQPEMMYTDGGSIPKAAQLFEGFSPWGYAPAYMIHDWLFIARFCNVDGTPTELEATMEGMDFQASADIIAEAIKTLVDDNRVKENDVAPRVISSTVAGPISRRIWNKKDNCENTRVSFEDRAAAEAGIPGSPTRELSIIRTLPDGSEKFVTAGQTVAVVSF
ncbi:MAG: hypothetical protein AAGI10_11655 [Pseudomonadota bacterium]